jgi:hypothetical protein
MEGRWLAYPFDVSCNTGSLDLRRYYFYSGAFEGKAIDQFAFKMVLSHLVVVGWGGPCNAKPS